MASARMIRRERKRRKLTEKYAEKRTGLLEIVKGQEASAEDKMAAQFALQKMPADASKVRNRNRCWITGRGNGVYRKVGICRNKLRILAMSGYVPGISKGSW